MHSIASRAATPRLRCAACRRPQAACWCALVQPMAHRAEVLILQHPLEAGHVKGTAQLLHRCLPRSRLEVGEAFDAQALHAWLSAPCALPAPGTAPRALLLYPPSPHDPALPLAAPPPLPAHWLAGDAAALRLVVLDGTWRKSRKMLYTNPLLQALPRLPLPLPPDLPAARYGRLRRAHAPHQLSTLEATCAALAQVEGDAARYAPVLDALEAFIDLQAASRPPAARAASLAGC